MGNPIQFSILRTKSSILPEWYSPIVVVVQYLTGDSLAGLASSLAEGSVRSLPLVRVLYSSTVKTREIHYLRAVTNIPVNRDISPR